jgi:CHASE3 domain sensor protein
VHTTAPTPVVHHIVRAAPAHRSGLPLVVGAAVLLVLVGISLALMRRVARLHREVTTA